MKLIYLLTQAHQLVPVTMYLPENTIPITLKRESPICLFALLTDK